MVNEILVEVADSLSLEYQTKGDALVFGKTAVVYRDFSTKENTNLQRNTSRLLYEKFLTQGIDLYQLSTSISAIKLREFIESKLKKQKILYGRKCVVGDISKEEYDKFLNRHHIQGTANSSIRLGLYHEGTIVGAVGFISSDFGLNLNRLCFGKYLVVGGASKLINHSEIVSSSNIETWCNLGYARGQVYEKLGFKKVNEVNSDMWYISKEGILLNRRNYQKKKLKSILDVFDESKTEVENMIENGYGVYYGPGTIRYTRTV